MGQMSLVSVRLPSKKSHTDFTVAAVEIKFVVDTGVCVDAALTV
jgi:hypothetical protein